MIPTLFASLLLASPADIEIRISGGRFVGKLVRLAADGKIRFVNGDKETYTVEAPGLLPGDVIVPPNGSAEIAPLYEAGRFTAMIEEVPTSEIDIQFEGRPITDPSLREAPFDAARRRDRQPLLFEPGQDPAYGAYTAFNLTGKGEAARQGALQMLYRLQEELSDDKPPRELSPYLTIPDWKRLRPTVSMTIGLGISAYDAKRFGSRVAYSRPKAFHAFGLAGPLKVADARGRDILLRVTSDSHWFNLQVCRTAWQRLGNQISSPTLESGYAPPRGRSPILGGFFDGIGNPTGADRERAVYGGKSGTYLALFRIRFDEQRFAKLTVAQQEALVGRRKGSGHLIPHGDPAGHRERAQNDGKSLIFRMPLIFDNGPGKTGLLFASVQESLDTQLERILKGFMLRKDTHRKQDSLLSLMQFESAAYYYVPPSYRGSYPGSLRGF